MKFELKTENENYSKFYSQMIENLESCLENKPIRVIS